ncbi:MAG TPA: hypothetical protein DCM45_05980 [Clostridiales bacterium]|nr:hypothetical protein [Clostridiales bacterium]
MENEHKHHGVTFGKIFWGLLIIIAAGALLLNGLGIDIGTSLPLVRIIGSVLLLAIAVSSISQFKFVLFFVPLTFIAWIWRAELGIPADNFKLWPILGAAVLLGIGLSVLFHRKSHVHVKISGTEDFGSTTETLNENEFVDIDASWGDHIKYVHADNLKQAKIKSSFASTKVYFDQCKVSPEGLNIIINASFSELVLNIPQDWELNNQIGTFAGEIHSMPPSRLDNKVRVNLTGSVNFAELKINYV